MGIISKQVNQRVTNRLAQPTRYVTALGADEVLGLVRGIVGSAGPTGRAGPAGPGPEFLRGGERLWLAGSAPGPWIIYFGPPSAKDPSKAVPTWTTQLALKASSSGTATLVTVSLAKWKTRDGMLVGRREFEQFVADLAAQIGARDPSYSLLDGSFFRS
jgi:hypothetical protein